MEIVIKAIASVLIMTGAVMIGRGAGSGYDERLMRIEGLLALIAGMTLLVLWETTLE